MRIANVSYSQWKSLVSSKGLFPQYIENPSSYDVFAIEDNISWETRILKDGGSDQTDFEANYKPTANKPVGSRGSQVTTGSDTYTIPGTGQVLSNILGFSRYGLQVQATGAFKLGLTTWNVVLEGSLDGVNYSTIFTSTDIIGQGIVWGGAIDAPALYIRSRCSALVLGTATNIVVTILGQE